MVPLTSNSDAPGLTCNVAADNGPTTSEDDVVVKGLNGIEFSLQQNTIEYAKYYWAWHMYLAVKDAGENWLGVVKYSITYLTECILEVLLVVCGCLTSYMSCRWALMKVCTNLNCWSGH
jgi:hypothetical protein